MNREELGKLVRQIWIDYAKEIGDTKPHNLTPWGELNEDDKEVDRRIGEALYKAGFEVGLNFTVTNRHN